MSNRMTPEELLGKLVQAATARRKMFEELNDAEFETFLKAVNRVGMLTVTAEAEGVSLGMMGMALDYYSRAIRMAGDEKLAEKVVA